MRNMESEQNLQNGSTLNFVLLHFQIQRPILHKKWRDQNSCKLVLLTK